MNTDLNTILAYINPRVINRYKKDYPNNTLPAEIAFQEILKYLWLTQKYHNDRKLDPKNKTLDFDCVVHNEMTEIDDMWHTFILFTRDYHEFCQKYFGHFIHHQPADPEQKISPKKFKLSFTRYLNYIYDNLGQQTVETWFAELLQDESES